MNLLKSSRLAWAGAFDRSAVKSAGIIVRALWVPPLPALKPTSVYRSPKLPGQSARPASDLLFIFDRPRWRRVPTAISRKAGAFLPLGGEEQVSGSAAKTIASANPCMQEACARVKWSPPPPRRYGSRQNTLASVASEQVGLRQCLQHRLQLLRQQPLALGLQVLEARLGCNRRFPRARTRSEERRV